MMIHNTKYLEKVDIEKKKGASAESKAIYNMCAQKESRVTREKQVIGMEKKKGAKKK